MSSHNISQESENHKYISHSYYALGTLIHQKLYTSPAQAKQIICGVTTLIARLEKIMSFYEVRSEINEINRQAGKSWVLVSSELLFIISEAKRYARLTNGLFNITVAILVNLWQQFGRVGLVPPDYIIDEKLKMVNYEDILIDEEKSRVKLRKTKQKIDLGGIAKGYIANCVIEFFDNYGLHSAMINLGGNVAVLGIREDGKPWQVGIQDPEQERGKCLASIGVNNTSVVTSGNYERFFLEGNRRYHHILDPFTGYPVNKGLNSVTIVHPDALLADVLSTAVFIAGLEEGIKLLHRFADIEAIIVSSNREIYLSHGIINKFQLITDNYKLYQF